jgi:hypothetical protein
MPSCPFEDSNCAYDVNPLNPMASNLSRFQKIANAAASQMKDKIFSQRQELCNNRVSIHMFVIITDRP